MRFHPLIQNSTRYFSQLKRVYRTQTPQNIIFQVYTSHFCQISTGIPFLPTDKNGKFLRFLHHNNNFKIFLPSVQTRFLRTLCTKLYQSEANFLKYVLLALITFLGLLYVLQNSLTTPFNDTYLDSFEAIGNGHT